MYEIAVQAEQATETTRRLAEASQALLAHKLAWMDEDLVGLDVTRVFDEALHGASWALVRAIDGYSAGLLANANAVDRTIGDLTGVDTGMAEELSEMSGASEASR